MDRIRRRAAIIGGAATAVLLWRQGEAVTFIVDSFRFAHEEGDVTTSYVWAGAVDQDSASVVAKVTGTSAKLEYDTDPAFGSPAETTAVTPDADGYCRFDLTGLTAATGYSYRVKNDTAALSGTFTTTPAAVASFTVAFGNCSDDSSNHIVYDNIRAASPLMFLHLGDFHYGDIVANDQTLYRSAIEAQFAQTRRAQLHREIPTAYVWDDHDYSADNGDSTAVSRPAAAAVYRQTVPHYTLPATGNSPIYQAFTIGRVRFVMLDVRHARSANSATDDASKTMLGATQKTWLKAEMDAYQADAGLALFVICNPQVWIADASVVDSWGIFATERAELADYLAANVTKQTMMLVGDAHAAAMDDGTNSDYSSAGYALQMPVALAAPLDQSRVAKGGPWSEGSDATADSSGRYGLLEVTDDGTTLGFTVSAISVDATTGAETTLYSLTDAALVPDFMTRLSPLHVMWADDPDWANPGDGNAVSSWRNAGSVGGNPAQATVANQPTFTASIPNLNNRAGVYFFAANSDALFVNVTDTAQPFKVLCVFRYTVATASTNIFALADTNDVDGLGITGAGNHYFRQGTTLSTATPANTTKHIARITSNGASSSLRLDGVSIASGDAGAQALAFITLGAAGGPGTGGIVDGHTRFSDSQIAFLGIYPGATADADLAALEADLAAYYGITI